MADCSPGTSQQSAEVNALNSKLAYDFAAQLQGQALVDNQNFARQTAALMQRSAEDAQTIKQLAIAGVVSAGQTGITENQQSVTPVRTATGDAIVGGVGVSAEQIAANVALGGGVILTSVTTALVNASNALAAILPVLVTASGGASTPSQTQAKPTTGTGTGTTA